MGQQQLLLLVLSTVIVGLATVAGIQAFSENQQQATQDALVQRAMSIGTDISAAANEPTQMGGLHLNEGNNKGEKKADVADAIGLSSATGIPADGAGENAACKIMSPGKGSVNVKCDEDGTYGSGQTITVAVDPGTSDPVTVNTINVTS
jgi:hypothetical protein